MIELARGQLPSRPEMHASNILISRTSSRFEQNNLRPDYFWKVQIFLVLSARVFCISSLLACVSRQDGKPNRNSTLHFKPLAPVDSFCRQESRIMLHMYVEATYNYLALPHHFHKHACNN